MTRTTALLLAFALGGCAGVADLSTTPPASVADRSGEVRRKADEALAAGRFDDAWNLEAQAGTDRSRLEAIALAALTAEKGAYDDMFPALRKKFGGLSTETRAKVDARAQEYEAAGRWADAVDVQLTTADDAPVYEAAWGVYRRVPVKEALATLTRIEKATAEAKAPAGSPK